MKSIEPRTSVGARARLRGLATAGALASLVAAHEVALAKAGSDSVNPDAVAALKSMGTYLRSMKSFTVHAQTSVEDVLDSGQKVEYSSEVQLRARLPDHLRVDITSDARQRQVFYDGKTLTQYAPRLKYYASVKVPGTAREVLDLAASEYDIDLPLADLFYWASNTPGFENIRSAFYVGANQIGGVRCDHYALRQQGLDWQIWIQQGAKPLPCKLVLTTTDDPAQPRYSATLRWDTQAAIADPVFSFVPPKGASRIAIVRLASGQ